MNRSAIAVIVGVGALASTAQAGANVARADAQLGLRHSAQAVIALEPALAHARRDGAAARERVTRALATSERLQRKAAAAVDRGLDRGRRSSARVLAAADRIVVRLDEAGRMQVAILHASADDRVQRRAASSVDATAELTSSLNVKVAGATVDGSAAGRITAAHTVRRRSPRVVAAVGSILRERRAAASAGVRDRLDRAFVSLVTTNARVAATLTSAMTTANRGGRFAIARALKATTKASRDIDRRVRASGQVEEQVSVTASADGEANGSLTLGDLAAASYSAAVGAAATGSAP